MRDWGCFLLISLIFLTINFSEKLTLADESHPGLALEAEYDEAVIAFNKKKVDDALHILNDILKTDPNYVEALELKALTLKGQGDDRQALETYIHLMHIKPEAERGPYYFEAAVLYNRAKQSDEAKKYFERALKLHFNEVAAHLFLGILNFNTGNPGEAENHFRAVAEGGTPELKVVAHYYLGMINFKKGFPAGGTSELMEAKGIASTIPDSQIASGIVSGADKILEPFRNGQWFGNVSLLAQYDSNVSQVPNTSVVPNQPTNIATTKFTISGGAGYMSAPVEPIQWVPSYRFNFNYNLNSDTKQFEYFTNTGSLYVNYRALSETTGGLKLEGNFTFENLPNTPGDTTGSYTFQKYSLTGDLGPFFRTQLSSQTRLELEFSIRPQDYYTSPTLNGNSYFARATVRHDVGSPWLNPGGGLSYENTRAADDNFKFTNYTASVFNVMRPTVRDTVTLSLDYSYIPYPASSPSRTDNTVTPHVSWLRVLASKWALLGDVMYTNNGSTLPESWAYTRWIIGAGISRSL